MENTEDENIQTLLSMGFYDVSKIRKALQLGNNDLNEAVSYLTSEVPMSPYSNVNEFDMGNGASSYNNGAPPAYGTLFPSISSGNISNADGTQKNSSEIESMQEDPEDNGLVFPYQYLVELEDRVYRDQWSIPYQNNESFALCLISATKLTENGLWNTDENCKKFVDRCMPECFNKLLMSSFVQKWLVDVQEGILEMLKLFLDLLIARLHHKPLPVDMLKILAMAFDPETDWHFKNRNRQIKLSELEPYARPPSTTNNFYNDPYGWLIHLINLFCDKGGLTQLQRAVEENENLDAVQFAAILKPFGLCTDYLNPSAIQPLISPIIERAGKYVRELKEDDFKQKKLGNLSELLTMMKLVYRTMWSKDVNSVDDLRLSVTLRMLKSPPFNAKMNALNEICKLIDNSQSAVAKVKKNAMEKEKVMDWLLTNGVLSIALEGHVDQSQYCDKIRNIVEFIGENMSMDELCHLWKMQNDQSMTVSENVQSIISGAAIFFNEQQLDQLFLFIHSSWLNDDEKRRQKLISFIGRIGHNSKSRQTMEKVLFLLWDLAHLPKSPASLVELALQEHQAILSDSSHVKDSLKKTFVIRCVEDIKKDSWVVPALTQMNDIVKSCAKPHNKTDRGILYEVNRQHDLLKLVSSSLTRCHKLAVNLAAEKRILLNGELMVDDRYKHSDYMWCHLKFLRFLLKNADLYLPYNRAKEVWDTLVSNKDACPEDNETCYEWFSYSLNDLEHDTIKLIFRERILKLEPAQLSLGAYNCLMKFLESTNVNEQKMKKLSGNLTVEKYDFHGSDFLWRICIECPCEEVAAMAIETLVVLSYTSASSTLKRDLKNLHNKFISECYKRLQSTIVTVEPSGGLAHAVNKVTKSLGANLIPDNSSNMPRGCKILAVERILRLAVNYILEVEKVYSDPRSLLPHGGSFIGYPLKIKINCESPKPQFTIMTHSNETVGKLRSRIAVKMNLSAECVQILLHDNILQPQYDHQYLHMCHFEHYQEIKVKTTVTTATITQDEDMTPINKNAAMMEIEQKLPSVLMANKGRDMFEVLYQLTEMNEPRITMHVRSLIMLIPSDPYICKKIQKIGCDREEDGTKFPGKNKSSPALVSTSTERPIALSIESSPKKNRNQRPVSLESLFSVSNPAINLFRLRYNLEVLSSLLMPVSDYQLSMHDPAAFLKLFLKNGGMQVVLNILQKEVVTESIDYDVDADTRRGCYAIALTIARFLLCDYSTSMDVGVSSSDPFDRYGTPRLSVSMEAAATPTSPIKRDYPESIPVNAVDSVATPTKKNRCSPSASLSQSPIVVPMEVPKVARSAVQLMEEEEFTFLVATLVKIAWFSSAAKLDQLTATKMSDYEGTSFSRARRWSRDSNASNLSNNMSPYSGRNTSTGSTSSNGSMESDIVFSSPEAQTNNNPDAVVAQQSLELLVTCLQLRRSHLECFFELPSINDFILDLLTRPMNEDVRSCAVEQFHLLSNIQSASKSTSRQFVSQIIMQARLPLWCQTTFLRPRSQVIVRNCLQFFQIRSLLVQDIVDNKEEKLCKVDPKQMLKDEISWLKSFEIPSSSEYLESSSARLLDNTLLTGHLQMIKTLVTCPQIEKKVIGAELIPKLLTEFLFPASKLLEKSTNSQQLLANFQPICSSANSRSAAFGVLIELCRNCMENIQHVSQQLRSMHHYNDLSRAKEFDFRPLVDPRPEHGLVGLKNAGATCYMNSILQQLFMVKSMAESILSTETENVHPETILYEMQKMFGHLTESRLQYHVPETFWKSFKLWGQPVNVREQQDAFMFFTDLSDQIDEYLKKKNLPRIFEKTFHGLFSDQKICEGCPHRYEREEPYLALNLPVKGGNLADSLDQFVAGEKLEGENAYFCEKCNTKRTALKRTCIKTLPPVLVIQLKRFGYDWNGSRALKFDHYFHFPMELDMTPYTVDSIAKQEGSSGVRSRHSTTDSHHFDLVGITVHSGQASAGHYYSYIKDRRGSQMTNSRYGKWFKFNDITVVEFDMNEHSLAEECFGGNYKSKVYDRDGAVSYDEDRLRYWNAYLLFYEKRQHLVLRGKNSLNSTKQHVTFKDLSSPVPSSPDISPPMSPKQSVDRRLSQLSSLIRKGDRNRMFTSRMPASISQLVRDDNLQFMRNRDIYCEPYFELVKNLASVNLHCVDSLPAIAVASLQLATQFLFNTYFRTRASLRKNLIEWEVIIQQIVTKSQPVCIWFLTQLNAEFQNVTSFLLECPDSEVRKVFMQILLKTFETLTLRHTAKDPQVIDSLMEKIVSLLDKDIAQHVKQSAQYFEFIKEFASLGGKACTCLLRYKGFVRLVRFLLGETACQSITVPRNVEAMEGVEIGGGGDAPPYSSIIKEDEDPPSRRWSSAQSREFTSLHAAIVNIVLHCDLSNMWTVPYNTVPHCRLQTLNVSQKIPLPTSVRTIIFGIVGKRLVQELLIASREVSTSFAPISDLLSFCSFNNETFTNTMLELLMNDIMNVNANEMSPLLNILLSVLCIDDSLHLSRLSFALEKSDNALLTIIKKFHNVDGPKCYQCIKLLVQLANKTQINKDYLKSISSQWSWSVTWLKDKMNLKTGYNPVKSTDFRSNESSTSKYFQRTMSAQNTLAEATALLDSEKEGETEEDAIEQL